jgi:hypothetical protein
MSVWLGWRKQGIHTEFWWRTSKNLLGIMIRAWKDNMKTDQGKYVLRMV